MGMDPAGVQHILGITRNKISLDCADRVFKRTANSSPVTRGFSMSLSTTSGIIPSLPIVFSASAESLKENTYTFGNAS